MLTKSHPSVRAILSKPEFKDAVVLARGGTSLILDHGDDTVTKLTIDEMGYSWLTAGSYGLNKMNDDSPYKFPILEDYDELGDYSYSKRMNDGRIKQFEHIIYGVRMPKLAKLKLGQLSADQKERYKFLKEAFNQAVCIDYTPDAANHFHKCAEVWIKRYPEDKHFEDVLLAAYYMCADYHARPDMLTGGNVLVYNDHLALLDPVFDPQVWANKQGRYTHHFDNPQGNKHAPKKLIQA